MPYKTPRSIRTHIKTSGSSGKVSSVGLDWYDVSFAQMDVLGGLAVAPRLLDPIIACNGTSYNTLHSSTATY